jgi:phosphate transport system substrate-binding protein
MVVRILAMLVLLASSLGAPAAADDPTMRVSAPHSLLPLVTSLAQQFGATNAITITVSERSSNAVTGPLRTGDLDLAVSDTETTDIAYHDTMIAAVPFAIVVNPATGATTLAAPRVKAIFEHTVTSWKDAGGANVPIVTIERPLRSATEVLLEGAFGLSPARHPDTIEDASGSVVAAVRANPGGIGIVGLQFAGSLTGVTVVTIGGAAPSAATIHASTYPLFAFEHAVTFGSATLTVSRFIAFMTTQSETWRENGFIPMRDLR